MLSVDTLLFNGNIISLSEAQPIASALIIRDGRILKVGSYDDMLPHVDAGTERMDLEGKTVVPGFVDSHIHLISLGLDMQVIDLDGISTKKELLKELRKSTSNTPEMNWIKGYGFEEKKMDTLPTRNELDTMFPVNPVYLEEKGSKICLVNTLAHSGVDETGVIRVDWEEDLFKAVNIPTMDPVDNHLREEELELAIEMASRRVVEEGVTSIHDPQLPPNALKAFKNAVRKGSSPLRLYLGCDCNKDIDLKEYLGEGMGTEQVPGRLKMGMVKLFADSRMPVNVFRERVKEAHNAGLQLSIHATNRLEMENALQALEEAIESNPRENHRHRIEHADVIDLGILERARKLGLVVAAQPEIVYKLEPEYPQGTMNAAYKSMARAGINVSGGSDSPTVPIKRRARRPLAYPTPLKGISFLVTRKTKSGEIIAGGEEVSVMDALKVYTVNGAFTSFEERVKGTLEEGKLADMVVLSENPLEVAPESIGDITVKMTIIGGKIVYQ